MNNPQAVGHTDWLRELLDEVGLQQFHSKLTNDLQLTKLSHFDYVHEEDLIQLGISRPATKRLLAAIKKRKSFVSSLKNKIVNKLLPSQPSTSRARDNLDHVSFPSDGIEDKITHDMNQPNSEFGRLTCLINSQDIRIKEEIGHGVHGFVKKGEWTTPNGRVVEVALKILRKDVMSEPGATFNDFVKEISVMHQLNHPNIIKLYGVVLSSPMMMVTELAPFGSLRDKLRKEDGKTPVSQLINFGVQIAAGMQYLESKRFIHRDLAARNIFVSHGKKILIGDLGLMRAIPNQENHYVMSEKTKIPYPWCAPESLRFKQFSSLSDVYMFGVTLWEMFSFGKEPWAGLGMLQIVEKISTPNKRLPCPEACPAMVYQTLLQCWNVEPSKRPNFTTLYQYLSTSYPLEVKSTQHISELAQKRQDGVLMPNDLTDSSSNSSHSSEDNIEQNKRKVLSCQVDDRIQVIEGQPEKYWWKGQNQRTFEIGWFPLSSTRWLAPKKGSNYISKPLKNSLIHTGHFGPDGRWGNPRFIDHMYLKNPLEPDDMNSFDARLVGVSRVKPHGNRTKPKSKLSRLFGIVDDPSTKANFLPQIYHKLCNEAAFSKQSAKMDPLPGVIFRSQSGNLTKQKQEEEPPLIDLNDENATINLNTSQVESSKQNISLIDMDTSFPSISEGLFRRSSDTQLNNIANDDDYNLSWGGSWNTGTFDGSNGDLYSAYYCPQDAAAASVDQVEQNSRYYSTVTNEH